MSSLLDEALKKVSTLPDDEQDAIAAQILDSLEDEQAWKHRFSENADLIRAWP